jgi:pectate lyase
MAVTRRMTSSGAKYLAVTVGTLLVACGTAGEQPSGGAANGGAQSTAGTNASGGVAGSVGAGGGGSGVSGTSGAAGTSSAGGTTGGSAGAGGSAAGSAGSGPTDCTTPPAPSTLVGWATEGSGTTGGGNQTPIVVTTAEQLTQSIAGDGPAVIHVSGSLSGNFNIGANKTVIGICGAEIHGHIGISAVSNVILRNLKVVGYNCTDSPASCRDGADAIGILGGAHHVWVDHLDVSDGSDGNLDVTQGGDFVTVSWTKFSYSSMRTDPVVGDSGHRFSNLIGASDTDTRDPGHLNITWHHCWWADNVDQRMPRSRRGQIHLFNNLFTAAGNSYCSNAGQDAKLLVQNSIYSGVNSPLQITQNGTLRSEGNEFPGSSGNQNGSGNGFTPTYSFTLDPVAGLEAAIQAGVGPK